MSDTTNGKSAEQKISIEIQKFYLTEQYCKAPQGAATFQNVSKQ